MIRASPKQIPPEITPAVDPLPSLPLSFLSPDFFASLSPPSPPCLSLSFSPLSLMISLCLHLSVLLPSSLSLETGLVAWLPSAAWFFFGGWVFLCVCVIPCAYARARVHVGFFYEVEIRWHLIDRHGLHGYPGDRVVGRDTYSSLGLSDHSWEK